MAKLLHTQCCIAGGGPAGVMLGFLLARAGVEVIVLEKHADFFRDFRGDTIHPSTMELLYELGLLDRFLSLPHQKLHELYVTAGENKVKLVDFSHLPVHAPYIALMPQWDFLSFLAEEGKKYPHFHLYQSAEVTGLMYEQNKICGVRAQTPDGEWEVRADLVVGADGRSSTIRALAGMEVTELGVPIDVLWLRIPKSRELKEQSLGYFRDGNMMVLIDRDDYYQCGYIIPKGKYEQIKLRGLEPFRAGIVSLAPFLAPYVHVIDSWDHISLLTVQINRLPRWYQEGLLCIGDAAHAMSPAGGVGVNLAVQDAVAAARILSAAFQRGRVTAEDLRAIQQRRELPARLIQAMQAFIHNNIINPTNIAGTQRRLRLPFWLFRHFPILQRIPARMVGIGFRPEHIQ